MPRHFQFLLWMAHEQRIWAGAELERGSTARAGERCVASEEDSSNVVIDTNGPLWPVLCHYLTLSTDQEERFRGVLSNLAAQSSSHRYSELRRELNRLNEVCEQTTQGFGSTKEKMQTLAQILDESQMEELLRWAERRRMQRIWSY